MSDLDWLSKDEVLSGYSGRRASKLLLEIELRTAHMFNQMRLAQRTLLQGKMPDWEAMDFDFLQSLDLLTDRSATVNIHDLEYTAPKWGALIPDEPRLKASIASLIGNKYRFRKQDVFELRQALGLDTEEVSLAFEQVNNKPLDTIYSASTPPDNRAFWLRTPGMTPELMIDVARAIAFVRVSWTKPVFAQGDVADGMYIIISGRVRAIRNQGTEDEVIIGEWGRGSSFGEEAVFLNGMHRSATVIALRDTELMYLTREKFDGLFFNHPNLAKSFTTQLVSRLTGSLAGSTRISNLSTIALVPTQPNVPLKTFTEHLQRALKPHGEILLLNSDIINARFGSGTSEQPGLNHEVVRWLNLIETGHTITLLQVDPTFTAWTERCLHMADRIIVVGEAGQSPMLGEVEQRLREASGDTEVGIELVLLQPTRQSQPADTIQWLSPRNVTRHHHVNLDTPSDFDRVARFMTGKAIGLVLSGGGARGIAHVGMVRALKEAGITLDMVGGASFGSIVAGMLALEHGAQPIYEMVKHASANSSRYLRPAVPLSSLFEGRRLNKLFQSNFGEVLSEDLWIPFFSVASNLTRSRVEILDRGPLWANVRASASIPSVMPPMLRDGSLLVDGGVMNNMPADIMKQRLEGGIVIASSTTAEDPETYDYSNDFTSWALLWQRVNPLSTADPVPGLIEVVSKTMALASKWNRSQQIINSDILINHPVGQYELFDYDAFDDLVDTGYRATIEALKTADLV